MLKQTKKNKIHNSISRRLIRKEKFQFYGNKMVDKTSHEYQCLCYGMPYDCSFTYPEIPASQLSVKDLENACTLLGFLKKKPLTEFIFNPRLGPVLNSRLSLSSLASS